MHFLRDVGHFHSTAPSARVGRAEGGEGTNDRAAQCGQIYLLLDVPSVSEQGGGLGGNKT